MASLNNLSVTFEVEPIVKLLCEETECEHNLVSKPGGWLACNLKHVVIGQGGVCADRAVKVVKKEE